MKNKKIRIKMIEFDYSHQQMAEKIGMQIPTWRDKINGRYKFYAEEIAKIAKVFNCKIEDLLD